MRSERANQTSRRGGSSDFKLKAPNLSVCMSASPALHFQDLPPPSCRRDLRTSTTLAVLYSSAKVALFVSFGLQFGARAPEAQRFHSRLVLV